MDWKDAVIEGQGIDRIYSEQTLIYDFLSFVDTPHFCPAPWPTRSMTCMRPSLVELQRYI